MKRLIKIFVTCSLLCGFSAFGLTGCDSMKPARQIDNLVTRLDVSDRPITDAFLQLIAAKDRRVKHSNSDNSSATEEGKVVYLTFDDGPSENTPEILDILNRYNVKATWFVLGTSGAFDYVSDIWDAGHQVAVHTTTHEYEDIYASPEAYWDDFNTTNARIKETLGFESTLFRFPGGSVNDFDVDVRDQLFADAQEKNLHYFDWNIDSGDATANGVPAETILEYVESASEGARVCCVLMHDLETKGTTVEALPSIIEFYQSQDYTFDVLTAKSYGFHF